MPGAGSWPYLELQCPRCAYFHPLESEFVDDSGYEILGFCAHPRIAMELFRPHEHRLNEGEGCPTFVRRAGVPSGSGDG